ncbi:MAG: XRE family transcriptional regulator [Acidobacteriota bacterium]
MEKISIINALQTRHHMIEANLGEAVRRLRERSHISLRTLAEKCDFSPSFISQVENGQASPSISSMEKIALALGVTLGEFFQSTENGASNVVRADGRLGLNSEWSKANIESLAHSAPGSKLEAVVVTLFAGGTSAKRPVSGTYEEFALVLSGSVSLTLGDQSEQLLNPGDAVSIRQGLARQWQNKGGETTQILVVSARFV